MRGKLGGIATTLLRHECAVPLELSFGVGGARLSLGEPPCILAPRRLGARLFGRERGLEVGARRSAAAAAPSAAAARARRRRTSASSARSFVVALG